MSDSLVVEVDFSQIELVVWLTVTVVYCSWDSCLICNNSIRLIGDGGHCIILRV